VGINSPEQNSVAMLKAAHNNVRIPLKLSAMNSRKGCVIKILKVVDLNLSHTEQHFVQVYPFSCSKVIL
jgi:hypothetical protein